MDATLHALGEILLKAVPTVLLVVVLHFYLKYVFFRPLKKVLAERYDATEGARKLAAQSLEKAAAKTADYEARLRVARTELYQVQERLYREMQERQAAQVAEARRNAEQMLRTAQAQIGLEVEQAKGALAGESDALAAQITEAVFRRSAA
ncbi:MAG: ATP synthase F0 subunit B [Bryobacteraceae bacterium]|jgi:F-type H+-transporting ATPase subunit b